MQIRLSIKWMSVVASSFCRENLSKGCRMAQTNRSWPTLPRQLLKTKVRYSPKGVVAVRGKDGYGNLDSPLRLPFENIFRTTPLLTELNAVEYRKRQTWKVGLQHE